MASAVLCFSAPWLVLCSPSVHGATESDTQSACSCTPRKEFRRTELEKVQRVDRVRLEDGDRAADGGGRERVEADVTAYVNQKRRRCAPQQALHPRHIVALSQQPVDCTARDTYLSSGPGYVHIDHSEGAGVRAVAQTHERSVAGCIHGCETAQRRREKSCVV